MLEKEVDKFPHTYALVPSYPSVQLSSPARLLFYCFKDRTVNHLWSVGVRSPNWFSKTSQHLSLSLTLGCNKRVLDVSVMCHVVMYPAPRLKQCIFSLPKNSTVICHIVSKHWFEWSVFLIHSAWTFASSVLVCNNQMFQCGCHAIICSLYLRESEKILSEANGTTEPCLKSLYYDRYNSNKNNLQTLGFLKDIYHQQLLNSTVETHHRLHVLIA